MKIARVGVWIACLLILTGCQNDSDYLIGDYHVITTVKLSSCPEKIFALPDDVMLPTSLLPGQSGILHWKLQRVGITGTGANKITIEITNAIYPDRGLSLSGILDDGFIQVETQQNIRETPCEVYRFVLLYGMIENTTLVGEIRTFLSSSGSSDRCPIVIPPSSPCEVSEEFTGTNAQFF